jgi:hypothetical protein
MHAFGYEDGIRIRRGTKTTGEIDCRSEKITVAIHGFARRESDPNPEQSRRGLVSRSEPFAYRKCAFEGI